MHRTEGTNYVVENDLRRFDNGPPGTRVTAEWLNAVQEELAGLIEAAGLILNEAATETSEQLASAIKLVGQSIGIPADTIMLIHGDVAPIGWTLLTDLDDYTVILTKGFAAGGNVGGAVHPTGVWQQPSYTLLAADIPAHTHIFEMVDWWHGGLASAGFPPRLRAAGAETSTPAGGSQGHDHGDFWRPAARCFVLCQMNAA